MKAIAAISLAWLGLGGCVAQAGPPRGQDSEAKDMRDAREEFMRRLASCTTEGLDRYVGMVLTAELEREIVQAARATSVRRLGPSGDMSMEGMTGRLTIHLDARGRIVRFFCG